MRDLQGLQLLLAAATGCMSGRTTSARPWHTLHARGMGSRSLARKLSSWRQFYDWLQQQQPSGSIPAWACAPKQDKPLPKALPVDGTAALLEHIPHEETLSLRDRALFELMYPPACACPKR
jgi:integrase/recombinase XerC